MESSQTTAVFKMLSFPNCRELTSGMDSLTVLPVCQGHQASSPSIYQGILFQFYRHGTHLCLSQQRGQICHTPIINGSQHHQSVGFTHTINRGDPQPSAGVCPMCPVAHVATSLRPPGGLAPIWQLSCRTVPENTCLTCEIQTQL